MAQLLKKRDFSEVFQKALAKSDLENPRKIVPESVMPPYKFLSEKDLDITSITDHMKVLQKIGVPYTDEMIENAVSDLVIQASNDRDTEGLEARYKNVNIRDFDGNSDKISEMDALIAYLQVLGTMVEFVD